MSSTGSWSDNLTPLASRLVAHEYVPFLGHFLVGTPSASSGAITRDFHENSKVFLEEFEMILRLDLGDAIAFFDHTKMAYSLARQESGAPVRKYSFRLQQTAARSLSNPSSS